jgi:hypothetical protein
LMMIDNRPMKSWFKSTLINITTNKKNK